MLDSLPPFIADHLQWWLAGIIVVGGVVIYGFSDLLRFNLIRVWAISGVSFAESIRRKVLWIAPLVMLGVIVICTLQRSIDEQDAIRQTIKSSLFACGLVVTMTTIILACTNLPKEIDTRVIFTVVTKPTTRLEIVAGKILGFAKVSAATLAIMGIFSLGYLHWRAWSMQRDIHERLAAGSIDPISSATYKYWATNGLLSSRTFEKADDFQVFARQPVGEDTWRWFYGKNEGEMLVPFQMSPQLLVPAGVPNAQPGDGGLIIRLRIAYDRSNYGRIGPEPMIFTDPRLGLPKAAPVSVTIRDKDRVEVLGPQQVNEGKSIVLTDPSGNTDVLVPIDPDSCKNLLGLSIIYVSVVGQGGGLVYGADIRHDPDPLKNPVCLIVPGASPETSKIVGPLPDRAGLPAIPRFRSRGGLYGEDLRGGDPSICPVSLFKFRDSTVSTGDTVAFELHCSIERNSDDSEESEATRLELVFVDRSTGKNSEPFYVSPENRRTAYFDVPSATIPRGDFDVYVRNASGGTFIGVKNESLLLVSAHGSFDWNLVKSLLILWMLSVLVVSFSIFCSTWLSWPIAVVLTIVLLLGHWGVLQLGDALSPGIGNSVANDIFGSSNASASQARVVSSTVEALTRLVTLLSTILPDISQFSAIEDIEQGITISLSRLLAPLLVLASFALPAVSLSYVILRNKEVAP